MEFKHKYGPVELEHRPATDSIETDRVWARYTGPVRQGNFGPVLDSPSGKEDTELRIYRRLGMDEMDGDGEWIEWRPHEPGRATIEDIGPRGWVIGDVIRDNWEFDPHVLEAAFTLLMDDYDSWQAAERAMGDPYP